MAAKLHKIFAGIEQKLQAGIQVTLAGAAKIERCAFGVRLQEQLGAQLAAGETQRLVKSERPPLRIDPVDVVAGIVPAAAKVIPALGRALQEIGGLLGTLEPRSIASGTPGLKVERILRPAKAFSWRSMKARLFSTSPEEGSLDKSSW